MQRQVMLPRFQQSSYFIFPESVGWYTDHPGHSVYRQEGYYETYSIHFIISGKGYVEIEGDQHVLQKGDAFLYFPYQEQRYYSSKDDPWNVRWVHFYGKHLKEFLLEKGFLRTLWTLKRWTELEEAFHELLLEAENNGILRQTNLSTLTYKILSEFMSYAAPLTGNRGMESVDRILALLPMMQQKACEPFILEEWAELTGVSTYYFCKLFRKATSMTPLSFITLCRIQFAKQHLIEKETMPVKDIAALAGYASASYFNQRFQEQEGMTPSEFRSLYAKGLLE
ncbi:AraC family transcriptional regulator [Paenibacillus sp. GCM10023248]|uniref:helix-turn-helix transcriptional regulator n=1 Tax=Bacillales TaxID=1385 RepID=UPI0023781548|nr:MULTISPECIES: helix-turn-helix domain-containing protein [Bacillales]MDD9269757.1 AraC family transcriptional regulator [Paenibacillus sp. MAHUQ-63]MDR6881831.1 AraC-like DNA-binding protein [Bacillus sp. 3255]